MNKLSLGRMLLVGALAAAAACSGAGGTSQSKHAVLYGSENCTLTQGYWRNHATAWPVLELSLGGTLYNQDQLLSILGMPVKGNGLVSLAHQLIATKLNLASGADPAGIATDVASADALIGALVVPPVGTGALSTSAATALVDALNAYNTGDVGPGHCDSGGPPPTAVCGNGKVEPGEQCDDGNDVHGDGCSCECTYENGPPPGSPAPGSPIS
jgi:cysteine-rich repeat protein